jgi:hypothetical protein
MGLTTQCRKTIYHEIRRKSSRKELFKTTRKEYRGIRSNSEEGQSTHRAVKPRMM